MTTATEGKIIKATMPEYLEYAIDVGWLTLSYREYADHISTMHLTKQGVTLFADWNLDGTLKGNIERR